MGTRSLTIMYDTPYRGTRGREIAVMYRQMDGYPTGHGQELKDFLAPFVIVNGYNTRDGSIANGGACLAAQIVAHFKDGVGDIYLHPAGTRSMDEEWVYEVRPHLAKDWNSGTITLVVREAVYDPAADKMDYIVRYSGPVGDFDPKAIEEALNGR